MFRSFLYELHLNFNTKTILHSLIVSIFLLATAFIGKFAARNRWIWENQENICILINRSTFHKPHVWLKGTCCWRVPVAEWYLLLNGTCCWTVPVANGTCCCHQACSCMYIFLVYAIMAIYGVTLLSQFVIYVNYFDQIFMMMLL